MYAIRSYYDGSACAVQEGQVIVDLSRMNRILEVNEDLAYAVIEPGVTQIQLFNYLKEKKLALWLDCTGSGPEASIVITSYSIHYTKLYEPGRTACLP